ncbi:glycosyltransferase [Halalkalibacter lacteus]|uniref:glycosyltransferase n=1 Tax=Halalkalibacter lacteus TaxID=3090663 RepID=UPI002FC907F1
MRDVGIVMPVYKQDPIYLELALRSILEQSFKDYYFVIVSDDAPSETVKVIRDITSGDQRVQLIIKEKNEGVAKALNTGFEFLMEVKEVKYLTWVSSDNIYYPTFIEKLRNALETSPDNIGLSYSSFQHIDANGEFLREPQIELFIKYQDQPKDKLLDFCFIGVSFMYKKQCATMIDGYKFEPVEDYEYWLRLTEICDIKYIPEVLMEYRTNSPLSISAQIKNSKEHHRRWRYVYNLARHQARNRRNIPFMLTIIYPVQYRMGRTIKKLEELLEQTFSNYKLLIIDQSINQTATQILKHIEDPRIQFISLPGGTEEEAIQKGIQYANTPLTLIYGEGDFPSSVSDLEYRVIKFNQINENIEKKGSLSRIKSVKDLVVATLYQTEKLMKLRGVQND